MFSHIFWDFDGTLFDTYPVMADAFKSTLALYSEYDTDIDIKDILPYMKISMGTVFQRYNKTFHKDDDFNKRFAKIRKTYEKTRALPFDGIFSLCKTASEQGFYNYLFTHRDMSALDFLRKFNLFDFFNDFVTEENGFEPKPSPQGLEYLLNKNGINKDDAVMIGDREIDILSAKNAGISACLYTEQKLEQTQTHADYIINDINELYAILQLNI